MRFPGFHPQASKPAAPLASPWPAKRFTSSSLLSDICHGVKTREPSSELVDRYQELCQQEQFSDSVENLLSFALHKHAVRKSSGHQQRKIFSRLGRILPQSFTLQEVLYSQRPVELREQFSRVQKELHAAHEDIAKLQQDAMHKRESHFEIESHLNNQLRERDAYVQQQARHLETMQASLTTQQAVQQEQHALREQERHFSEQQREALNHQLRLAHAERDEMAEQLTEEMRIADAFLAQRFRYAESGSISPRRRHASEARVRPVSTIVSGAVRPPLPPG